MMRRLLLLLVLCVSSMPLMISAETRTDLQKQIDDHNAQITALQKDIAQYESKLNEVSGKKKTLQNTLKQINLSLKKTSASIKVTKNKISATQLQIHQLADKIDTTQTQINKDSSALAESIRTVAIAEDQPLAVQLMTSDTLATMWHDIDLSAQLQGAMGDRIGTLTVHKKELGDTKVSVEGKKVVLEKQHQTLVVQKGSITATQLAQADLLKQTKAQEANFQNLLAQKRAQEAAFEQSLMDLQARLNYVVKASDITAARAGVLSWPVDSVRITQYFGNTPFAASGAYSGKGHNGVDLGAHIGTAIRAALTGTVVGTGNTDAMRGCYSFGKWVLIKHNNGLDTLYAHLSQILVSQGQSVTTGDLVGYSGETGYATGPHLHFGVYVSAATQIMRLGDATKRHLTPCADVYMPVAPLTGYLNPLNYLPAS